MAFAKSMVASSENWPILVSCDRMKTSTPSYTAEETSVVSWRASPMWLVSIDSSTCDCRKIGLAS